MNILIVDDQANHRDLLEAILTKWPDQQVTAVEDGATALSWLAAPGNRFDLVFLDAQMPGMSGLEVLERLQHSAAHGAPSVVMCTASLDRPTIDKAFELGAESFLVKPCTAENIAEKLWQFGAISHARCA